MSTLNHYRKQAGYTSIKAFAEAAQQAGVRIRVSTWTFGVGEQFYERDLSTSIMSQWLNGYRSDVDETPLLALLHIDREQYLDAYEESRDTYMAKWREKHPVTPEMLAAHKASIKKAADEAWAKMTDAQKHQVHQDAIRLGIAQPERRSPLDIMIDRACGLE